MVDKKTKARPEAPHSKAKQPVLKTNQIPAPEIFNQLRPLPNPSQTPYFWPLFSPHTPLHHHTATPAKKKGLQTSVDVSHVVTHHSTKSPQPRLTSQFGMGYGAFGVV